VTFIYIHGEITRSPPLSGIIFKRILGYTGTHQKEDGDFIYPSNLNGIIVRNMYIITANMGFREGINEKRLHI